MLIYNNFTTSIPFANFTAENWKVCVRDRVNPKHNSFDKFKIRILQNVHQETIYIFKNYIN